MHPSPEKQREMLRLMQTIRRFEERAADDYHAGDIYGVVHSYIGEEASGVGVCAALNRDDQIISTHRGHGHCIAKGADLNRMMAELYGRETGYCKGKGGSMHIADFDIGMLGANGIVAGGIPIITGAGLAAQLEGKNRVAVAFFGDGASNAGPFHESINIAASWKLPVIYVCENNHWAAQTPSTATLALPDVASRAAAYGIPGVIVDGNDALDVYRATKQAADRARGGGGPTLIEAKTMRMKGHAEHDAASYVPQEMIELWRKKDPIARLEKHLRLKPAEQEQVEARVRGEIRRDADAALAAPMARAELALDGVFCEGCHELPRAVPTWSPEARMNAERKG